MIPTAAVAAVVAPDFNTQVATAVRPSAALAVSVNDWLPKPRTGTGP